MLASVSYEIQVLMYDQYYFTIASDLSYKDAQRSCKWLRMADNPLTVRALTRGN